MKDSTAEIWRPARFWVVENGKLVAYTRFGECKQCGECCRGWVITYTCSISFANSGDVVRLWNYKDEEDPLSSEYWVNYEDFSIFYAQGMWWYFKIFSIEKAEDSSEKAGEASEDGMTTGRCPNQRGNLCDEWEDAAEFRPICRYWPMHPKCLEPFPNCGFEFERFHERGE